MDEGVLQRIRYGMKPSIQGRVALIKKMMRESHLRCFIHVKGD